LWGYWYDAVSRANFTVLAPHQDGPPPGQIFMGAGAARVRGAATGDILTLRGADGVSRPFVVRQVLHPASALLTNDLLVMHPDDFHPFLGHPPGFFTDITLEVPHSREVSLVARRVLERLPSSRVITRSDMVNTYRGVLDWRHGMLMLMLSGALLAFVILAWDKASGLSAEERREIGILKGLGWDTRDIMTSKLQEGGLLSLGAFLLGYLLAWGQVFLLDAPLFSAFLKGWSVLYPAFPLTPRVDALDILILGFFTVLPYTAATLVPVWRAAVSDPDAVMR
ncbi:MAG: ABC transporter permease, partial [Magnetococcus sp. WYHC-3]